MSGPRRQSRPTHKRPEPANPKKGRKLVKMFTALSLIFIAAIVLIHIQLNTAETANLRFNPDRINEATRLYNALLNFDHIADYPETPEEVMELYLKTVHLLYGDMLRSEYYILNIIERQRMFLSEDILSRNRIMDQFNAFMTNLEEIIEMGAVTISFDQRAPIFPNIERNVAQIRVTMFNAGVRNTHLVYTLSSENPSGRWRIIHWEVTDANFNPISELEALDT